MTLPNLPSTDDRPLLALETSGKSASVALLGPHGIIDALESDPLRGSASTLAPSIEMLCKRLGVSPSDLKAIAVTVGPGSFTGLRVGVATAKCMAYALQIPVLAIDTLEALALQVATEKRPDLADRSLRFWTVLDAYRGELFVASWKLCPLSEGGHLVNLTPSTILAAARWFEMLGEERLSAGDSPCEQGTPAMPLLLVGPGTKRVPGLNVPPFRDRCTLLAEWQPRAIEVARLGAFKLERGDVTDPFALMPRYLRGSAAEEKRLLQGTKPGGHLGT